MQCPYYNKHDILKRFRGVMGYCELQKCDIMKQLQVGKIPNMICESQNGRSNAQCGVYSHFGKQGSKR